MEAIIRAVKLAIFDRRTAVSLMFDSAAMGDAVLVVAAIQALLVGIEFVRFRVFSLTGLLQSVILAVAGWLILSAAIWLMGTKLLKGRGELDAMMRTSGFGRVPLVLAAVGFGWVGLIWHLAVLVLVAGVVLSLGLKEAVAAVALGAALVYVIQLLFRATFFAF